MLLATLIFGANYWVAKGLMPDYLSPFQVSFLRVFVSVIMFWLVARFYAGEEVARRDLIRLSLCALFGIALNQLLFFTGLRFTTPIDTALIHTVNPIMVLVLAWLILREPITPFRLLGVLTGAAGAIWLILQGGPVHLFTAELKGNILVFLNCTAYAVYLVLIKPLMAKYRPLTIMKWVFLFGLIWIFPVTIKPFIGINWTVLTPRAWLSLAYIIFGTTLLAYLLTVFALKKLSPTLVSFYMYLQPLIVGLIGLLAGVEVFSCQRLAAALLLFVGVYLVNRPQGLKKVAKRNE